MSSVQDGHTLHFIVSGHGSIATPSSHTYHANYLKPATSHFLSAQTDINKHAGGFVLMDIQTERTHVDFYDSEPKVLYKFDITKGNP